MKLTQGGNSGGAGRNDSDYTVASISPSFSLADSWVGPTSRT